MSENISFKSAELGAPIETLGYEQARAELEQVVRQLESGASDRETSIALWERADWCAGRGACGELAPPPRRVPRPSGASRIH